MSETQQALSPLRRGTTGMGEKQRSEGPESSLTAPLSAYLTTASGWGVGGALVKAWATPMATWPGRVPGSRELSRSAVSSPSESRPVPGCHDLRLYYAPGRI